MIKKIAKDLKDFHNNEDGDVVQNGIMIALMAVIAIGAYKFLGPKIKELFNKAGNALDEGAGYEY